ncbi:MAG: hypothetical protein OEM28_09890 [Nitrosopumilus sp.]|nr:hypothetical protein [Nitrosopumilus sp.]
MTFHKYLGDSKIFEYDKHYKECRQQNKPFIKARTNPSHGNYYVQIDLITCNYEFTKKEQEEIIKLFKIEMKSIKSSSNIQNFSIDKELVWFDGVSPEQINDFCNCLYDLTQEYPG